MSEDEKSAGPTWGVWQPESERPRAAYAQYNHHHGGLMIYDAGTGRALTVRAHRTLDSVVQHEPFTPNDKAPARADYVGERNDPSDPVKHAARAAATPPEKPS